MSRRAGKSDSRPLRINASIQRVKQCSKMVPGEGVEPSLPRGNWILNPARLPIPPSGHREKNRSYLEIFGIWQPWSYACAGSSLLYGEHFCCAGFLEPPLRANWFVSVRKQGRVAFFDQPKIWSTHCFNCGLCMYFKKLLFLGYLSVWKDILIWPVFWYELRQVFCPFLSRIPKIPL